MGIVQLPGKHFKDHFIALDKRREKAYLIEISSNQEGAVYDYSNCGEAHRGTSSG
jgi:hypothetical protein